MTRVLNDPVWWPLINYTCLVNYFIAVCFAAVVYDWALTFGQEFELILVKRWSFMTILYVCVRHCYDRSWHVVPTSTYTSAYLLLNLPISLTDTGCTIVWFIQAWGPVVVNAMLGVIMIARINAMYQGSKKLRIFLVVMLLGSTIASGVMTMIGNSGVSAHEVVLSGYHMCFSDIGTYMGNLTYENVISVAVWEIFALFLTIRIVIMHFRELRQSPRRPIIGDYFTILLESHAFYFLAFAIMACLQLGTTSPNIALSSSVGSAVFTGILSISQMLQMFVLGPRLILSIREYHAKLVARADGGIEMTSLAFHAGGDALTSDDV